MEGGTAYEHTTESHTHSGPPPIKADVEYVKSLPGLLKVAEIVLCVLVLICASVPYWSHLGGGWVQFVAVSALLTTVFLFLLHFFNALPRLPGPWHFIEFLYYCIECVLLVIAAIVCCVRAGYDPAIGAATFFTFAALVVYGIDTYFQYREWQEKQHMGAGATATTTTTTTTYETRTQY